MRRLLSGAVLLLAVSALAFTMLYANSDNVARRVLGQNATPEQVQRRMVELGLDRPLWQQYVDWLGAAVRGDFGRSWFTGEVVTDGVASRLSVTLSIVLGATVLSALAGTLLGLLAARRGGAVDGAVQVVSVLGFAVPGFLVALGLVLVFSLELGWFKATGYVPLTTSVGGWLSSVTLPVLALALGTTVVVAQQIRGAVLDAMSRDYVRTLRSRGLSETRVIAKHVLRNAAGPALAVLAVQFIGLLGGAVIVEQVFAIPGLGQLAVSSTVKADIPMVMGLVVATAVIVVVVNLLIDLAHAGLNPKVRLA
jgi:peptide/nickel transport system permease protein